MTRAASAGCASPATPNTASRRRRHAQRVLGMVSISHEAAHPRRRGSRDPGPLGAGRRRPRSATACLQRIRRLQSSQDEGGGPRPRGRSSTLRRENTTDSRLDLSAACRISSPPTGGCSATGTTSTSGDASVAQDAVRSQACSRRSSRSNTTRHPVCEAPLLALAAALTLAAPAAAQVKLNGAGATFPNIIYQDWMLSYNQAHPDVQSELSVDRLGRRYSPVLRRHRRFRRDRRPMKDSAIAAINGNVLHIPPCLVATSRRTTSRMSRKPCGSPPTSWRTFSSEDHEVERCADRSRETRRQAAGYRCRRGAPLRRSGTSFIWTDYLSKVSAEWEQKVGRARRSTGRRAGGKGNEGVTATVKQTPGAIGYVELATRRQQAAGRQCPE